VRGGRPRGEVVHQMYVIGNRSLIFVAVTLGFIGMVMIYQACLQFTKVTAVSYAAKGVRLNCVIPGLMFTPLVERLAARYNKGDFEGMVAKRHAQVPIGRMGDAWDVANATLFLCSDEARYITGTELVVDGGLTAFTGFPA